jgi:exodeoxyribonuclease VII large subunit
MADSGDIPSTLAGLLQSKSKSRHPKTAAKEPQLGLNFAPDPPPNRPRTPPIQAAPKPEASKVWTVRSLVANIRQQLERGYLDLWVEGEISNLRPAPSGHLYFTLKDGEAQLGIVLFRRQAQLLRFRPADGMAVKVRGRISVYEQRGQLQLIAETLEEQGTGALLHAFEQLKARLRAEGLFDRPKKPLPPFPHCIGIVTSPTGAVIRDIMNVVRRRHARLNLLIYPGVMQGPHCARSVIKAIHWFNAHPERVDLIVLARGGGSIEDLADFNDESLARAIAASTLPVVSAIGHETDFTIADFVADLRAPTPSAAAELVTAAQHRIEERVASLARRVYRAGQYHLLQARQRLARLSADQVLARVHDAINRREQRVDELRFRLNGAQDRLFRAKATRLQSPESRLRRHDPTLRLVSAQRRLARCHESLDRLAKQLTATRHIRLERAHTRLEALSPLAVLNRGYAIVFTEDGRIVRDAETTAAGQRITARVAKGTLRATITETRNQ